MGVIDSSSKEAALDSLQQGGLMVLSLRERIKKGVWWNVRIRLSGVTQKDVVIFSRQLATLFEAQVPVASSLKILIDQTSRPELKEAIVKIFDDVSGGLNLSQAMSKHPDIFSAFYISLVRSGEESGKLQNVFVYLADYLERSYHITSKVKNAMIYPAFVFSTFAIVFTLMLVVVVPRMTSIFEETGQAIPWYTQTLIATSLFLRNWGFLIILFIVMGLIFLWRWGHTKPGRATLNRLQITIPIIGNLYQSFFMARLADNLQTLITSGIPILRALSITSTVVGNSVYEDAIFRAIESVKGGGSISSALEKERLIPALVTQMIKIGEATGRLDFILGNISKFYQAEVDSAVDNLVALIEPIMIVVLGVAVGALVGAILVPLYSLIGSF